jgi:hypothetical protein
MKLIAYLLFAIVLFTGCFKEPNYPPEPVIQFMSVTSTADPILALTSDVYIQFSFQDGDGNLGRRSDDDTTANMYVKDLRTGFVNSLAYSIPPIPQKGSSPGVKGDISFNFRNSLFCNPLDPGKMQDTIVYEIYVKDRAGNISNTITTSPIIVKCF